MEPELMVKLRFPLVPPPGAGLSTLTVAVPAVLSKVEATAALRLLLLTKVVGRAVPFQFTTEPEMKLLPDTVRVMAAEPAVAEAGDMEARAGTGLVVVAL